MVKHIEPPANLREIPMTARSTHYLEFLFEEELARNLGCGPKAIMKLTVIRQPERPKGSSYTPRILKPRSEYLEGKSDILIKEQSLLSFDTQYAESSFSLPINPGKPSDEFKDIQFDGDEVITYASRLNNIHTESNEKIWMMIESGNEKYPLPNRFEIGLYSVFYTTYSVGTSVETCEPSFFSSHRNTFNVDLQAGQNVFNFQVESPILSHMTIMTPEVAIVNNLSNQLEIRVPDDFQSTISMLTQTFYLGYHHRVSSSSSESIYPNNGERFNHRIRHSNINTLSRDIKLSTLITLLKGNGIFGDRFVWSLTQKCKFPDGSSKTKELIGNQEVRCEISSAYNSATRLRYFSFESTLKFPTNFDSTQFPPSVNYKQTVKYEVSYKVYITIDFAHIGPESETESVTFDFPILFGDYLPEEDILELKPIPNAMPPIPTERRKGTFWSKASIKFPFGRQK